MSDESLKEFKARIAHDLWMVSEAQRLYFECDKDSLSAEFQSRKRNYEIWAQQLGVRVHSMLAGDE